MEGLSDPFVTQFLPKENCSDNSPEFTARRVRTRSLIFESVKAATVPERHRPGPLKIEVAGLSQPQHP